MKKHKPSTSKQKKDSRSSAEVFVLPPDLLAKLGISLGNIQQPEIVSQLVTTPLNDTAQSVHHSISNNLSENEDKSSIIETANLMKKSVFLSPTFFQMPSSITDEEEPTTADESAITLNSLKCRSLPEQYESNVVTAPRIDTASKYNETKILDDSIANNYSTKTPVKEINHTNNSDMSKDYKADNQGVNLISTDILYQNDKVEEKSKDKLSSAVNSADDHTDEAYLSDSSNSYTGFSPKRVNSVVYKQSTSVEGINKEMCNEKPNESLHMNVTQDNDIVHSSSDAVLTEQQSYKNVCDKKNKQKFNTVSKFSIDEPAMELRNIEIKQNVSISNIIPQKPAKRKKEGDQASNTEIDNHDTTDIISNEYDGNIKQIITNTIIGSSFLNSKDKQDSEDPQQAVTELTSVTDVIPSRTLAKQNTCMNEKQNGSSSNVGLVNDNTESDNQDRVKEIAAYLSQIANERKKNMKNKIKCNPIIAELCVQGVEKPGGIITQKNKLNLLKVTKTYHRANKRQQIPLRIPILQEKLTPDSFQLIRNHDQSDSQINDIEVEYLSDKEKFCICEDFGNLGYYDREMLYEHIHFWFHNNNECDLETLYSIYNEQYSIFNRNADLVEDGYQSEQDTNTTLQNTICWNELDILENCDQEKSDKSGYKLSAMRNVTKNKINTAIKATNIPKSLKCSKNNKNCTEDLTHTNSEGITMNMTLTIASTNDRSDSEHFIESKTTRATAVPSNLKKSTLKRKTSLNTVANNAELPITEPNNITNGTLKLTVESPKEIKSVKEKDTTKSKNNSSLCNISSETPKSTVKSDDKNKKAENTKRSQALSSDIIVKMSIETPIPAVKSFTTTKSRKDKNHTNEFTTEKLAKEDQAKTLRSKEKSAEKDKLAKKKDSQKNIYVIPAFNIDTETDKKAVDPTDVEHDNSVHTIKAPKSDTKYKSKSAEKGKSVKTEGANKHRSSEKEKDTKSVQTANFDTETTSSNIDQKHGTPKSSKRQSNTMEDNELAKKRRTTESNKDANTLNQDRIQENTPLAKPSTVLKQTISEKSYIVSDASVRNSHISDSTISYDRNVTANEDSVLLDDSMDLTIEDSIIKNTTSKEAQSTECSSSRTMSGNLIKCGVCAAHIKKTKWSVHRWKKHDYLSWQDGETPLNLEDETEVKKHLLSISNESNGLTCVKCNLTRKRPKTFLSHIKRCMYSNSSVETAEDEVSIAEESQRDEDGDSRVCVTCGVCGDIVSKSKWIDHIQVKHTYLAWTTEERPLDVKDEDEVKKHLHHISKNNGGLICNSCNARIVYAKTYLNHINNICEFRSNPLSDENLSSIKREKTEFIISDVVTCGVCKMDVVGTDWIRHIQVAHEYMAWIAGEEPLDVENDSEIKAHLEMIVRIAGELVCTRCGERRKRGFTYLQHKKACEKTGFDLINQVEPKLHVDKGKFVCGVCHEIGILSEWHSHAISTHYNIAWKVGEIPINLRNPYAVEKYLKQYKNIRGKLTCLKCKESRSSCYGFYAHILTCGRTPEEIEDVMNVCEICNNKYLCIYRNQHMAAHKDSEMRRIMREEKAMKMAEEEHAKNIEPSPLQPMGKRKAAVKATRVIQKHSSNMVDGKPVCGCGTLFHNMEEYAEHDCAAKKTKEDDDSDVSVKLEPESEDDDYIDSGVSDEEGDQTLRKRSRVGESANKLQRIPYKIPNVNAYLLEAYKDFSSLHYSSENLFDAWRGMEYQRVPSEEKNEYLPQVLESCKIQFGNRLKEGWFTYKRFESNKNPGYSMFIGGASQCIAWAPPSVEEQSVDNYLAVSAHRSADVPRHGAGELPRHRASLQLLHFGGFEAKPYLALSIAHDYGIVWAMDWCPSGARDGSSPVVPRESPDQTPPRLGLLAIACSNGAAYILAVPCPPANTDKEDPPMYKLKPAAELRLTMSHERRVYQATGVRWSQQKGHSTIIVGYSDGTTALYDLKTESPFLKITENGVTIYYPFQERRTEACSVTSVGLFTTANESYPTGGQWSTSMTGGTLVGKGLRPTSRCHLAISGALHAAHWPAVTLSGDAPFMRGVSEMEWWGGGRRGGAGRAWAACGRCARAASACAPALRLHAHHPAHNEIKKLVAALLLMVPLGHKPKHAANDELSVVVEPLTYEDAVDKYGLQLNLVPSKKVEQSQAQAICNENEFRPDRYPLSDIVSMAFCPSAKFHDRLAFATHSGFLFVLCV